MEVGAVDCTLSLGTGIKRDVSIPTGVSRTGSPTIDLREPVTFFQSKSQWQPVMLETHLNLLTACPSGFIRDIFPKESLLNNHTRVGASVSGVHGKSGFRKPAAENVSCNLARSSGEDLFMHTRRAFAYSGNSQAIAEASSNPAVGSSKDFMKTVPSGLGSPIIVIPELGAPESKCGDPTRSGVPSPLSVQSSVNGDELFPPRSTTDSEVDGSGAISCRNVGRACARCGTMKTPLWRNGPLGPKSLCNACGIRFKKASKRNLSCETSSEILDSEPSSPASVRSSFTKGPKRKMKRSVMVSKESWIAGAERRVMNGELSLTQWKRNRISGGVRGRTESSERESGETFRSRGSSCVTWQPLRRAPSSNDFGGPEPSVRLLSASSNLSLTGCIPMDESCSDDDTPKLSQRSRLTFAADEEEGAKLLMALSCGLVHS